MCRAAVGSGAPGAAEEAPFVPLVEAEAAPAPDGAFEAENTTLETSRVSIIFLRCDSVDPVALVVCIRLKVIMLWFSEGNQAILDRMIDHLPYCRCSDFIALLASNKISSTRHETFELDKTRPLV